jgi:hypothetical protein
MVWKLANETGKQAIDICHRAVPKPGGRTRQIQ